MNVYSAFGNVLTNSVTLAASQASNTCAIEASGRWPCPIP